MSPAANTLSVTPNEIAASVSSAVRAGGRFAGLMATARGDGSNVLRAVVASPGQLTALETVLEPGTSTYPAITPLVAPASWYEREIHDLFDIVPVGHPRLDPLVLPLRPGEPRPLPGATGRTSSSGARRLGAVQSRQRRGSLHDPVRSGPLGGVRERRVPGRDAR